MLRFPQMLHYLYDPYDYFLACRRRYGDPFLSPSIDGDLFVTGTPEGVRAIFAAAPETYEVFGAGLLSDIIGPHSLLMIGGERHRAERKLLAPPFHGARMRTYGQLMRAITRKHTRSWQAGMPVNLLDVAQAISLDVIVEAVFGMTEPRKVEEYRRFCLDIVSSLRASFVFNRWLRRDFFGLSAWSRYRRVRERAQAALMPEIAARRAAAAGGEDVLSLLLGARYEDGSPMEDAAVYDELGTILTAGHETTAITLAWIFYFLHRHPETLERLRAEVLGLGPDPEPEAIARLPYLDAVCSETMRLRPITPQVVRKLRLPLSLCGYELPAGTGVSACLLLVHRREDLYPEPEKFRPERFLERSYSPFEFLPFGGGARRCLGAAFASYEMKLVVATILADKRLRLTRERPPRVEARSTTVGPRGGVPMEVLAN